LLVVISLLYFLFLINFLNNKENEAFMQSYDEELVCRLLDGLKKIRRKRNGSFFF